MAPPPRAGEEPAGPICAWRHRAPSGTCPGSLLRSPGSRVCSHQGPRGLRATWRPRGLVWLPASLPGGPQEKRRPQHLPPGNGAKAAAPPPPAANSRPPRSFLFQEHAEPVPPRDFGTSSSFDLGFAYPSFLRGWNLFVILVYSQMPPPDHRPKQHPPELTNHSLFCTAAIQVLFRGLLNISPPVPELRMGNKWRTGSERQDRVLEDVQWPLWVFNLLSLTPRERGVTEVARPGSRGRAQADRKGPAGHVGTSPHPLTAHPPPCSGRDQVGDREGPGPPKSSRPGGRASPFSLFNLALLS